MVDRVEGEGKVGEGGVEWSGGKGSRREGGSGEGEG